MRVIALSHKTNKKHLKDLISEILRACNLEIQTGGKKKLKNKILLKKKGGMSNSDIYELKMNDLIITSEDFIYETNIIRQLLLRKDGFSNEEINRLKDSQGFIKMPNLLDRNNKQQSSKDFPSKEEINSLNSILQTDKITLKFINA